ncbi:unnamed protein product [Didymodactylos carnosus]|uniref:HEAT repeat domain-containing protein n=1 Tax=Didymodactylos carnosus TaxID=1234261 RepID=A0A814AJ91_9BILA|nr:unnamed protein product [Didymodactylos carnosus]CAF1095221.1 unnamed protein product [Didymodactylos carnosus]CAF3696265.1 unnamed protein product [Didymodactylos carnosus]CAF3856646.1 unnamed protein product [Didymodactylos carnosus]
MGASAAVPGVIKALLSSLGDQDGDVRGSVVGYLDCMGASAVTSGVIKARALCNMRTSRATPEAIKALLTALDDEQESVRWHAAEGLGRMGESVATHEMIIGALDNSRTLISINESNECNVVVDVVEFKLVCTAKIRSIVAMVVDNNRTEIMNIFCNPEMPSSYIHQMALNKLNILLMERNECSLYIDDNTDVDLDTTIQDLFDRVSNVGSRL